ncbi:MAG: hypothetical protein O2967_06755 [Proteobacteria bacterium]|nr:hypothetical protein [Pseudomonadota bacterium]
MKLFLAHQPNQPSRKPFEPGNEILRLAAELLEDSGHWAAIDVRDAHLKHWNGRKVSIARSDIADLIDRGLLDRDGRWTDFGRHELARLAGMEATVALLRQLP